MKTKKPFQKSKSGGVLLMAMLVMLAFSILAIGLYQMSATNAVETVYQDHLTQAFWVAESGLQDAAQRLVSDEDFRSLATGGSASFTVSNSTERTRYDVTVTDSGDGNAISEHFEYDVVSTGWKGGMNRRIKQRVATRPGFISAIMAPGNINIAANTIVSGPIMVLDDGELIIDDKIPPGQNAEGDYDIIILDENASINQKKSGANEGSDYGVLELSVPDDIPDMPNYSSYLSTANLLPILSGTTNLGTVAVAGTQYYNFPDGMVITKITGSGTIVNTGDIEINGDVNNVGDVSSDVAVISFGSVSVGQKTDFDGNTLIYGFETVEFGDGSFMAGNSAILADGGDDGVDNDDIIMGGQSEFYGIIFADEGDVVIQAGSGGAANTRIIGTVISGNDVDMGSNSEIIFDPDYFYAGDLLNLTQFWKTDVITTKKTWEVDPEL